MEYYERARNTFIHNNSIKYNRYNESTRVEENACLIRLSAGAMYTTIENNCFTTDQKENLGITHYFIKEYPKKGKTNDSYGYQESYLKLSNTQCIDPDILYDAIDFVYPRLTRKRLKN